ncbi:unnamed protein product [Phytophthora fragariaefolia]|uniref:Unnamed protein product n=1 Tax=Phytophthora fragariaefolia TaxID=1490495 RepID=A0A9W7D1C6_9STRA|nr:unnamed protein product [Phytophthora fragariaefolia]
MWSSTRRAGRLGDAGVHRQDRDRLIPTKIGALEKDVARNMQMIDELLDSSAGHHREPRYSWTCSQGEAHWCPDAYDAPAAVGAQNNVTTPDVEPAVPRRATAEELPEGVSSGAIILATA